MHLAKNGAFYLVQLSTTRMQEEMTSLLVLEIASQFANAFSKLKPV